MENEKDLKELVQELARAEHKSSSLWWTFWRGIVNGLGFFIGSAIVAAILIYVLTIIFKHSPLSNQFQDLMNSVKNLKQ